MLNQLKIDNLTSILMQMLVDKSNTKQGLSAKTGLSNTTVSDFVNSMLKINFLASYGSEESFGGRPSLVYKINKKYGTFLGIHLAAEKIHFLLCDTCCNPIESGEMLYSEEKPVIQLIFSMIESVIKKLDNPLLAIGIGLEAAIDFENQIVLEYPPLGWQNVHLKEMVERRFYIPTYIEHIINGQILVHRIQNGFWSENHLLVANEALPHKTGIYLNHIVCRGHKNLCGLNTDENLSISDIGNTANFLGITEIVISVSSTEWENKVREQSQKYPLLNFSVFEESALQLTLGMALYAETRWFKSIYFLMQKNK